MPGVISYTWSYGDGSPSVITTTAPTNHVFTNTTTATKTFTVRLIASNGFGCVDSSFGNPIVFPKPIPNFSATPIQGCSPMVVSFTNSSVGNNSSAWLFDNGQASIFTNPTITFTNAPGSGPITYSVKLVVGTINNCYDSIIKPINLFARPLAAFGVDTPACSPAKLKFTNNSTGANTYNWNFGNSVTSTLTSPENIFTNFLPTNQTGRVIVMHEDTLTGGIAGEIASLITENCFDYLDAPVMREGSLDTPVPMNVDLEHNFLPKERFKQKLMKLWKY